MNIDDMKSLSEKTREDGGRLFAVSEWLFKAGMTVIWVIAIVAGIATIALISQGSFGIGMGLILALAATALCFFIYIVTVLSTHVAKVLVHLSFSNIALLEHFNESKS